MLHHPLRRLRFRVTRHYTLHHVLLRQPPVPVDALEAQAGKATRRNFQIHSGWTSSSLSHHSIIRESQCHVRAVNLYDLQVLGGLPPVGSVENDAIVLRWRHGRPFSVSQTGEANHGEYSVLCFSMVHTMYVFFSPLNMPLNQIPCSFPGGRRRHHGLETTCRAILGLKLDFAHRDLDLRRCFRRDNCSHHICRHHQKSPRC